MSSIRRVTSSRTNGALSRGPVSESGKQLSAANGIQHGLLAKCVVLQDESQETFDSLLDQHLRRFAPPEGFEPGSVEMGMIEEMAAAHWRMRRLWAIETRMMDDGTDQQTSEDEVARITQAFADLAETNKFNVLNRYESRLHRIYQRSLRTLLQIPQQKRPSEPT